MRYATLLLLTIVSMVYGDVRQIRQNLSLLPPVTPQKTLAERVEIKAVGAAKIERRKALEDLAGVTGVTNKNSVTSAEIKADVDKIKTTIKELANYNKNKDKIKQDK